MSEKNRTGSHRSAVFSDLDRPTLDVARSLLGKNLCRKVNGQCLRLPIFEVEAYDGFEDKASHAHRGKTPRNAVMFGPAGVWYVYLCYGVHWMLNIVTGAQNYPAAVLLRGAGTIKGPGRLTKKLQIDQTCNGKSTQPDTKLWIEDTGLRIPDHCIQRTPRIGVSYAGETWASKPYRFCVIPHTKKK